MDGIIAVSFTVGMVLFFLIAYILIYVTNARVAHVKREFDSLHQEFDRYLLATGQELGWLDLADSLQEQIKDVILESAAETAALPRIQQLLRCDDAQARRMYRQVYDFLVGTGQFAGGEATMASVSA